MPLQQGEMLNNRYRIVKLLGQGGFGAVYRAWDTNLNRPCAVKENLDASPEAHRQFGREATVLANLSHPNLPRVTDHFSLPEQGQYLVMDFVDGEDLASKLEKGGALPIEQALHWVMQVADALTYLHSRTPPVLHRDITPANIRIPPEGAAMLVDFGLVKVAAAHMKTTVGARAVTPGYAPPEQYGQGTTDSRTDLYALGATLYSLLTGQRPMDSLQRMMGKAMPAVMQLNPQIPETLSKVIERVMSLEARQRYQSAEDFKAALSISIPTLPGSGALAGFSAATVAMSPEAAARLAAPAAQIHPAAQPPAAARSPVYAPPRQAPVAQHPVGQHSVAQPPVAGQPAYPRQQPAASPKYRPAGKDSAPRRGGKTAFILGALGLGVLLCLGALLAWPYVQDYVQSNGEISDADFQATVDERVLRTSTAQAEQTRAVETHTTDSTPASGAETTEQAIQQFIDAALANRTQVLGPIQGSLAHNPGSQVIAGRMLSVDVKDFIFEVRFYNPYAASQAGWDYGLLFRHIGANQHVRLIIRSDKSLVVMNNVGEPNGNILFQGDIPDLNIEEGGWNLLTVYCLATPQGERGFIYINKIFVVEVDLSVRSNAGDIAVVTGTYEGDQVEGESTDYQDLSLWSVP